MNVSQTRKIFVSGVVALVALLQLGSAANACLPDRHKHLNYHCATSSPFNRLLGVVLGEGARPRQIAVLAGVSRYPNLPASLQLSPAEHDLRMLSDVLIKRLQFDEVIIIKNEDFNHNNLRYLFENYLPDTLQDNPRSRVLFAFSGHGSDFDNSGFLYFPETRTIKADRYSDLQDAIGLASLKVMMSPTMRNAHQFLALVNACNGGHFLDVGMHFGATALDEKGAHGITAGGAKDTVHAYSNVGTGQGSVFFEMVTAALAGRDVTVGGRRFEDPAREDGILTTTKLADYLSNTVSIIENYKLSPRMGALTGRGAGNQGEFFFVTDYERAKAALSRRFPQDVRRVFGSNDQAARDQAAREQAARERAAREQAAREQAAREQAAREQAAREQAAREQAARDQAAREQAAREQAAREQAAREQAARDQAAREQAARDQAARDQAAREQAAREQAARERVASVPPPSSPADEKPVLLGQYGDWGAYEATSGGRKRCYALAKPKSTRTEPPNRPRNPSYAFVTTRPAESIRNEVSIVAGVRFNADSEASVAIGGARYPMYTKDDTAWIKNPNEEGRMIDQMRGGSEMRISGTSAQGTKVFDTYDLGRLAQALDHVARACR